MGGNRKTATEINWGMALLGLMWYLLWPARDPTALLSGQKEMLTGGDALWLFLTSCLKQTEGGNLGPLLFLRQSFGLRNA